jgi:integrase
VSAVRWAQRLSVVRGFARHRRCVDPATEVPPTDAVLAPRHRLPARLFSDDDIAAMLTAADTLRPALRASTDATFFGLLAVTGMRVGEAIGLDRADVDIRAGTISIDDTKFRKHRLLPIHPTTIDALTAYAQARDQARPVPLSPAFFVSTRGTRLQDVCVHKAFTTVAARAGVVAEPGSEPVRVHGFRHSFAVTTLRDWYRHGDDPAARLPTLSAYLGHADPAYTYWYLQACPDLLGLAADRLEQWEQQR